MTKKQEYRVCEKKGCRRRRKQLHECNGLLLCKSCYAAQMNKENYWCKAIKQAQEIDLVH